MLFLFFSILKYETNTFTMIESSSDLSIARNTKVSGLNSARMKILIAHFHVRHVSPQKMTSS